MELIWSINLYFISLVFFFTLCEFLFSLVKGDGAYPTNPSINHLIRYILLTLFGRFLAPIITTIYIKIISIVHGDVNNVFRIDYFIFSIILVDFINYWTHKIHHEYPLLKSIHFVHHSDWGFNLMMGLRLSLIQKIYYPIQYIPLLIAGFSITEIYLATLLFGTYQLFTHSAYIRLPRFFDYVFVTPHNHRIHHDQALVNQNSNFGGIFSIWDRLFGTYVSDIKEFTPGIKGYSQDNFIMMEVDPIVRYAKGLLRR